MMKKYGKSLFICAVLISFTLICYFIRLQQSGTDSLNRFIFELSKGNQMRSILAIAVIMGLGIGTLMNMNVYSDNVKMLFLLSMPAGIALWGILSILVMILGIKYNMITMLLTCLVMEVLIFVVRKRKKNFLRYNREEIVNFSISSFGIVCALSTGAVYVYSAGDTFAFIDLLGKAFVIEGGFSNHFEEIFLSTGIGLAPLSSLAYMLGTDNIYLIHSAFLLYFFFFLWHFLYHKIINSLFAQYAKGLSFICSVLIITMPPVLYLSGWIISNVYIMCYIIILEILLLEYANEDKVNIGFGILMGLFTVFFVYLRCDALITLSCFSLAAVIEKISNKKMISSIIIPGLLAMILYYGKIYLVLGAECDGLFLDVKTIGAMLALILCFLIYYAFFRNKRLLLLQKYMVPIVIISLLLVMAVLCMISPEMFIQCMNVYNINTTDISPQGGFWGVTGIFVLMMLFLSHIYNNSKIRGMEFLVIILILTNMIMGPLRTYLGQPPRIGIGDSFNRAFISYLPLALWVVYDRVFAEKDFCDTIQKR